MTYTINVKRLQYCLSVSLEAEVYLLEVSKRFTLMYNIYIADALGWDLTVSYFEIYKHIDRSFSLVTISVEFFI